MDENSAPKKSWLQTLPGLLTAVSAAVVALATIVGALTPLFGWIGDYFQPTGCSNRSEYPLGRWNAAEINGAPPGPQYSTYIMFTTPKGGTWLPSQGQGSFTASNAPSPHAEVILTVKTDYEAKYESKNKLVVSADGCRMEGTFADNEANRGSVVYVYAGDQKTSRK
jgi:hypothetical protein